MPYWTTQDRPVDEQFSYWREVVCEAFTPLATRRSSTHRPAGPREAGLHGWVESKMLISTNCSEASSRTQLLTHGGPEVRRTSTANVFVNLQLRGHCVAEQGNRECVVQAGEFALFDTTSPFRLEFVEDPTTRDWRVLSFRVPRATLAPLLADPGGSVSVTHPTARPGAASLVASTMIALWSNLDALDRAGMDAAESAFTTTLAACVGSAGGPRDTSRAGQDSALRASVHRYLVSNLRTADLGAATVARRFAISVRKLHGLYENSDLTLGQTIMGLRVEGCARELGHTAAAGSLTELAARWGFCDLSHLNRAFRAHRGCLPSEFRSLAAVPKHLRGTWESAPRSSRQADEARPEPVRTGFDSYGGGGGI